MKMCLLEVAMFERFRSSHFQSEWVVKILRTAGEGGKGVKECYDWGDYFCWGGWSVPHYMPLLFQISHNYVTECTLQQDFC